jgi:hypothetical protein
MPRREASTTNEPAAAPATTPPPPAVRFIGDRGAIRFGDRAIEPGEIVACPSAHRDTVLECARRADFIGADDPWPAPEGKKHVVRFEDGKKLVELIDIKPKE